MEATEPSALDARDAGIVPRACQELFAAAAERRPLGIETTVEVSPLRTRVDCSLLPPELSSRTHTYTHTHPAPMPEPCGGSGAGELRGGVRARGERPPTRARRRGAEPRGRAAVRAGRHLR
jgi:hypothetical protein